MNILEIIALIAEPDADVRMQSIKRLALLETQPKLNVVRIDIKEVKPSQFPKAAASIVLSNNNQVDVTYENIEQLNKFVPKPPFTVPYATNLGKALNDTDFKLTLDNGDYCYITKKVIGDLYNFANPPSAIPVGRFNIKRWYKNYGEATKLELDCCDIIDLPDHLAIAIYNRVIKVEGKSDELIEILDKLSNAIETNDDLTFNDVKEEYKQWRSRNM